MKTLVLGLGKLVLLLAGLALITGVSLFVVGGYLATWPVLRQNPRTARKQAIMQAAVSLLALAQTFAPDIDGEGDGEVAPKSYQGRPLAGSGPGE